MWHFCISCVTLKIEKVQYPALKYVFNDFNSSYDILRRRANVPLLYTRRRKTVLLEVYKAYRSDDPQYLSEVFKKQKVLTLGTVYVSPCTAQVQFYNVWVT